MSSFARRPAVLFDLDGTLVDTIQLILDSVTHAFHGRKSAPSREQWVAGIGRPLITQLGEWEHDETELARLVDRYRGYQRLHHDRLTRCYTDVLTVVRTLHELGHPLGVVTSKADEMAHRALAHVGLARYMSLVLGCDSCTRHKPDPEPVRLALERLDRLPAEAAFVGDSPHDVAAGNAAGVATVGVLWGPFTREQLEPFKPTRTIERMAQLPAVIEELFPLAGDSDD